MEPLRQVFRRCTSTSTQRRHVTSLFRTSVRSIRVKNDSDIIFKVVRLDQNLSTSSLPLAKKDTWQCFLDLRWPWLLTFNSCDLHVINYSTSCERRWSNDDLNLSMIYVVEHRVIDEWAEHSVCCWRHVLRERHKHGVHTCPLHAASPRYVTIQTRQ